MLDRSMYYPYLVNVIYMLRTNRILDISPINCVITDTHIIDETINKNVFRKIILMI